MEIVHKSTIFYHIKIRGKLVDIFFLIRGGGRRLGTFLIIRYKNRSKKMFGVQELLKMFKVIQKLLTRLVDIMLLLKALLHVTSK